MEGLFKALHNDVVFLSIIIYLIMNYLFIIVQFSWLNPKEGDNYYKRAILNL